MVTDPDQPYQSWIDGRLSADDLKVLDAITIQLSEEQVSTPVLLLVAWRAHVEKLEADLSAPGSSGSVWGAFDLIAALCLRDLVQIGVSRLETALRSRFESLLSEVDMRFLSFTEPDGLSRVERVDARDGGERGWWWKRIPVTGPAREEVILYSELG